MPRMKQSNLRATLLILTSLKVRFEEVAGVTCQREIAEVIGAAARLGSDVFNLKRKVEYDLRRVAVFAAAYCSFSDGWIERIHEERWRTRLLVRATVASSSTSMSDSNSARSSVESVERRARSSCIRSYWAWVR